MFVLQVSDENAELQGGVMVDRPHGVGGSSSEVDPQRGRSKRRPEQYILQSYFLFHPFLLSHYTPLQFLVTCLLCCCVRALVWLCAV